MYLPLGAHVVSDEEVAAAGERLNRFEHNPDALLGEVEFDSRRDAIERRPSPPRRRDSWLRSRQPDADKKALGMRIREVNGELAELLEPLGQRTRPSSTRSSRSEGGFGDTHRPHVPVLFLGPLPRSPTRSGRARPARRGSCTRMLASAAMVRVIIARPDRAWRTRGKEHTMAACCRSRSSAPRAASASTSARRAATTSRTSPCSTARMTAPSAASAWTRAPTGRSRWTSVKPSDAMTRAGRSPGLGCLARSAVSAPRPHAVVDVELGLLALSIPDEPLVVSRVHTAPIASANGQSGEPSSTAATGSVRPRPPGRPSCSA